MSGQSWDPRYGRSRTGPLQISTPVRLPGGIWGPPPASGVVSYGAQGEPVSGFGVVESSANGMARAEWPFPVRWEIQAALSFALVSGGIGANNFEFSPGDFRIFIELTSFIESASAKQSLVLEYGAGIYPMVQNLVFKEAIPSTYVLTAQRVEMRVLSIEDNGIGSTQVWNSSWRWNVNFLPALASAGWPAV